MLKNVGYNVWRGDALNWGQLILPLRTSVWLCLVDTSRPLFCSTYNGDWRVKSYQRWLREACFKTYSSMLPTCFKLPQECLKKDSRMLEEGFKYEYASSMLQVSFKYASNMIQAGFIRSRVLGVQPYFDPII